MLALDRSKTRQSSNGTGVLVAGIGNIFLGDDAFGSEVARRLLDRTWPERVCVRDFGIRAYDLAFALLDPWDLVLLVDAMPRGDPPGTLYLIEPDAVDGLPTALDSHSMNPLRVFGMVRAMAGVLPRIRIIGCEPFVVGSEEEPIMGLSEPVEQAVSGAIEMIESEIARVLGPDRGVHEAEWAQEHGEGSS